MGSSLSSHTDQLTPVVTKNALSGWKLRRFRDVAAFVFLVLLTIAILYPFAFVIFTSLKTSNEVRINPIGLPQHLLFANFSDAWNQGHFSVFMKNSLIIVIPVVISVIICSLMASYAFARLKFKFSNGLFLLFIIGQGLPLEVVLIPLYYMMKDMGQLNHYTSVIFPMIGIILPFGILLLTGFISEIPSEIFDSAKVDWANEWQTLWRIVLPIAKPGIISLLVFSFLWTWNQFFLPTVMITDNNFRTLPVGLAYFIGSFDTEQNLLAAGSLITAAPIIILYLFFQRQFVRGITVGAFK
jgi:raffinose/stachyose/melibiose transport system permease protein